MPTNTPELLSAKGVEGMEWIQTSGEGLQNELLVNNHWELMHPENLQIMSPTEYYTWWESTVAPTVGDIAKELAWTFTKR